VMPPAASIAISSPPIWRASSTTPAASPALWDTMTSPTTDAPCRSAEPGGAVQDLDRVHGLDAGGLLDVPAAGLRVAHRQVGAGITDLREEARADVHRDLVFLALEAVGAGHATARGVVLDHPQLGDQRHEVQRRLADAVALL